MAVVNIVNGKTLTDKEYDTHLKKCRQRNGRGFEKLKRRSSHAGWPLRSDGLAVWPQQVKEAEEHARKIGVPTEFDKRTGQCILTDRGHRARYLRANGVRDNDGGYKET